MRILLLNQYYAPDEASTAQLLTDVGEGLAAAGHEVRAICSRRSYADPARAYPAREQRSGVSIRRLSATAFGRGRSLGRLLDYLSFFAGATGQVLLGPRPDAVVSLSTPPMIALLGLVARLRGARSVYWVMDVYPDLAFELGVLHSRSAAGRALAVLARLQLRRSDAVVALGECMARKLESAGGRPVAVVHNWADGDVIRPRPLDDHPLRKRWGWDGRFVVLYSGNLGLAHEFGTTLDAAERLRGRADVLFAFVGGGPRRAEVEAEARRRGLDNVEFRPYVAREELGASLTAGNVHLVTLRTGVEGLLVPSKIYGILAAGRPALYVGPADGEVAEILRAGACGERVREGEAEALADAVLAYAGDARRCEAEGRAARALFDARFTRAHGVGAIERLIREAGRGDAGRS